MVFYQLTLAAARRQATQVTSGVKQPAPVLAMS